MPPKSKKGAQAAKAKKLEDKTFGMKNKKGAKNQKFIANEQKAAGLDKGAAARAEAKRIEDRRRKIEEEKMLKRQQELLKAKIQKAKEAAALKSGNIPKEAPPTEGNEEQQTVSGPSLTLTLGPTEPTAEQLAKLARKNAPKKEKVVEVIVTLEELIEKERAALQKKGNLTPVTAETFTAWKEKIQKQKAAQKKKQMDKKTLQQKTGREFFTQNPSVAIKDADEADEEEVDARIEVREKRMTEEDEGVTVFEEEGLLIVEKLAISKPGDLTAPPVGGNNSAITDA